MIKHRIFVFILLAAVIFSCTKDSDTAISSSDTIKIGVVTLSGLYSEEGIRLAVEQINNAGGILGKKIEAVYRGDNASVLEGKLIAQEFSEDPDLLAVVGHENSHVAIPVSSIYEFNNKLFLVPSATSPQLTEQGYKNIFRNILSDRELAKSLAQYLDTKQFRRILIISAQNDYGRHLANEMEYYMGNYGLEVVDRVTYADGTDNFNHAFDYLAEIPIDVVVISGSLPEAGAAIEAVRDAGMTIPVIGSDIAYSSLGDIGDAVENVFAIDYFHPDDPREKVKQFVTAFFDRYGVMPDSWAAQGYDAVTLLAYVIRMAGSVDIDLIRGEYHKVENWEGVTGIHSFNENGDVTGKQLILTKFDDGEFVYHPF